MDYGVTCRESQILCSTLLSLLCLLWLPPSLPSALICEICGSFLIQTWRLEESNKTGGYFMVFFIFQGGIYCLCALLRLFPSLRSSVSSAVPPSLLLFAFLGALRERQFFSRPSMFHFSITIKITIRITISACAGSRYFASFVHFVVNPPFLLSVFSGPSVVNYSPLPSSSFPANFRHQLEGIGGLLIRAEFAV